MLPIPLKIFPPNAIYRAVEVWHTPNATEKLKMNIDKFTSKFQEAIAETQSLTKDSTRFQTRAEKLGTRLEVCAIIAQ